MSNWSCRFFSLATPRRFRTPLDKDQRIVVATTILFLSPTRWPRLTAVRFAVFWLKTIRQWPSIFCSTPTSRVFQHARRGFTDARRQRLVAASRNSTSGYRRIRVGEADVPHFGLQRAVTEDDEEQRCVTLLVARPVGKPHAPRCSRSRLFGVKFSTQAKASRAFQASGSASSTGSLARPPRLRSEAGRHQHQQRDATRNGGRGRRAALSMEATRYCGRDGVASAA